MKTKKRKFLNVNWQKGSVRRWKKSFIPASILGGVFGTITLFKLNSWIITNDTRIYTILVMLNVLFSTLLSISVTMMIISALREPINRRYRRYKYNRFAYHYNKCIFDIQNNENLDMVRKRVNEILTSKLYQNTKYELVIDRIRVGYMLRMNQPLDDFLYSYF